MPIFAQIDIRTRSLDFMNPIEDRLPAEYFRKDALDLAPELF